MFDSFTQDNRLAISRFYCFWFVRTVLKNVKKFSRIVCVSLFSYQGFFVLSLRQLVYFITITSACQVLFLSFFRGVLMFVCRSQATCLLYHMFVSLSTIIFVFFKTFQIVYSEETILRDSSVRITLSNRAVNTFFKKS